MSTAEKKSSTKMSFLYQTRMFLYMHWCIWFECVANLFYNLGICRCYRRWAVSVPNSLVGKTILVTGGTSGIGRECAKVCLTRGAKIILTCRDVERAKKVIEQMVVEVGDDKAKNVILVKLDLSDLSSVRAGVQFLNSQITSIDVLINNAGVMMTPEWTSPDGFEYQFATNHLGHFLLTNLLLPKLKTAPAARIINVTSLAFYSGQMFYENLNMTGAYSPEKGYARSKLANILFTQQLAERLKSGNITAYAVHPGVVRTEIARHLSSAVRFGYRIFQRAIMISPVVGAQTTLYCALAPEVACHSGGYYENCHQVEKLPPHATDEKSAERLWNLSLKLCDIVNDD